MSLGQGLVARQRLKNPRIIASLVTRELVGVGGHFSSIEFELHINEEMVKAFLPIYANVVYS